MFLVKSAFWLTVAYLVIHPDPGTLAGAAKSASSQALAAGRQLVATELVQNPCLLAGCAGPGLPGPVAKAAQLPGVAFPAAASAPPVASPIAPIPRPPPRRLG
jgi:hypothetical protein